MKDLKNIDEFEAYAAREFFKNHKVYRYHTVKIDDMDDNKVRQIIHWYCEENNLIDEYSCFHSREHNLWVGRKHLGKTIKVTVDRPLGSHHPNHKDIVYPVNYGYYEEIFAPDGEKQDVYILGIYELVSCFTGKIIAIIHRLNDIEDKWVVAPEEFIFSKDDIIEATKFQEQYFEIEVII